MYGTPLDSPPSASHTELEPLAGAQDVRRPERDADPVRRVEQVERLVLRPTFQLRHTFVFMAGVGLALQLARWGEVPGVWIAHAFGLAATVMICQSLLFSTEKFLAAAMFGGGVYLLSADFFDLSSDRRSDVLYYWPILYVFGCGFGFAISMAVNGGLGRLERKVITVAVESPSSEPLTARRRFCFWFLTTLAAGMLCASHYIGIEQQLVTRGADRLPNVMLLVAWLLVIGVTIGTPSYFWGALVWGLIPLFAICVVFVELCMSPLPVGNDPIGQVIALMIGLVFGGAFFGTVFFLLGLIFTAVLRETVRPLIAYNFRERWTSVTRDESM